MSQVVIQILSLSLKSLNTVVLNAYLEENWDQKDIKAQYFFFHLYLEFLTTVLNLFQTSESVFQDVARVIKYNFQMEAQPDLVNPNQFAKSICIRV